MIEFDLDTLEVRRSEVPDTRDLKSHDRRRVFKRDVARRHKKRIATDGEIRCEVCDWRPEALIAAGDDKWWKLLNAHHVVPVSCGGKDRPANVVILCPNCHGIAHRLGRRVRLGKRWEWAGPTSRDELLAVLREAVHEPATYASKRKHYEDAWSQLL